MLLFIYLFYYYFLLYTAINCPNFFWGESGGGGGLSSSGACSNISSTFLLSSTTQAAITEDLLELNPNSSQPRDYLTILVSVATIFYTLNTTISETVFFSAPVKSDT